MIQQPNDGQTTTMGHEEWRCSGTSVSYQKNKPHESQGANHAESDYVIPTSNVAGSIPTQQRTIDHAHQLDIRLEPINPDILPSTAKRLVDS